MYDDLSSRPIQTDPTHWGLNRFLRGYLGAIPASLALGVLLYLFDWIDFVEAYGIGPMIAGFVIMPAIFALRAMQVMPVGEEASFLRTRIMPKVGDGLRGIVLLALLLTAWAFSAFVLLGTLGIIFSGVRRLLM